MNGQQPPSPNTIKNPQRLQVEKTPAMNDRDIINDALATEKYLTDNFNVFAREASNKVLHGEVMRILGETHEAARNVFDLMFKLGQYKLTAASQQDIQETSQQFQNYAQQQSPY